MLGVVVVAVVAAFPTMTFTHGASPKKLPFASDIFHVPVDFAIGVRRDHRNRDLVLSTGINCLRECYRGASHRVSADECPLEAWLPGATTGILHQPRFCKLLARRHICVVGYGYVVLKAKPRHEVVGLLTAVPGVPLALSAENVLNTTIVLAGVGVLFGVFVGMAAAVWVRPEAKVDTAIV